MEEYMKQLDMQLVTWLEYNNREIDAANDATIGLNGLNGLKDSSNFKAKVIASAILGKNLVGPEYDGIEKLMKTKDKTITALREADTPELKYNVLVSREFQYIASELSSNYILDKYLEVKENGDLDKIKKENILDENQDKELSENKTVYDNFENRFESEEADYKFENEPVKTVQENTTSNLYDNNPSVAQNYTNEYSGFNMNYNSQDQVEANLDIKNNFMRKSEGNEKENVIENGLDTYIHGIRTVITPSENGCYNFKMELTMDNYNTVMWVNEKEMSKDEYIQFVNQHENEILEKKANYSNEISHDNEVNYDSDLVYNREPKPNW